MLNDLAKFSSPFLAYAQTHQHLKCNGHQVKSGLTKCEGTIFEPTMVAAQPSATNKDGWPDSKIHSQRKGFACTSYLLKDVAGESHAS